MTPTSYKTCSMASSESKILVFHILAFRRFLARQKFLTYTFFRRRFVLCPECDNPETDLLVSTKRNTISQGCKACGYHGLIESNHKLVTYILKNPPTLNPATQGSSLTKGKRSKRSKKNGDTNANGEGQDEDCVDAPPETTIKNVSNQTTPIPFTKSPPCFSSWSKNNSHYIKTLRFKGSKYVFLVI